MRVIVRGVAKGSLFHCRDLFCYDLQLYCSAACLKLCNIIYIHGFNIYYEIYIDTCKYLVVSQEYRTFFPECVARVPVSLWGSGG